MKREYIDSEAILSFAYDPDNRVLEIEFRKHRALWHYFDVPVEVWVGLYNSTSRGNYFVTHIKGNYKEARVKQKKS